MALNNRAYNRIATRFNRLLLKVSATKQDPTNWGEYGGAPLLVIEAPPNQTADLVQIKDSAGNVLYSIGANGRPVLTAPQKTLTVGTTTSLADIALPASGMVGGTIHYVARLSDGTDFQSLSGIVTYSAVNKAGTITGTITEVTANQAKTVTGASTLTIAWTIVAGANKVTIKAQPTTSLTVSSTDITFTLTPIVGGAAIL